MNFDELHNHIINESKLGALQNIGGKVFKKINFTDHKGVKRTSAVDATYPTPSTKHAARLTKQASYALRNPDAPSLPKGFTKTIQTPADTLPMDQKRRIAQLLRGDPANKIPGYIGSRGKLRRMKDPMTGKDIGYDTRDLDPSSKEALPNPLKEGKADVLKAMQKLFGKKRPVTTIPDNPKGTDLGFPKAGDDPGALFKTTKDVNLPGKGQKLFAPASRDASPLFGDAEDVVLPGGKAGPLKKTVLPGTDQKGAIKKLFKEGKFKSFLNLFKGKPSTGKEAGKAIDATTKSVNQGMKAGYPPSPDLGLRTPAGGKKIDKDSGAPGSVVPYRYSKPNRAGNMTIKKDPEMTQHNLDLAKQQLTNKQKIINFLKSAGLGATSAAASYGYGEYMKSKGYTQGGQDVIDDIAPQIDRLNKK